MAACAAASLAASSAAHGFDLDDVVARARQLAAEPYREPTRVPGWLLDIDYDRWRKIRFRPEHALWRGTGLPFHVQFFHPGLYYDRTVRIHQVDAEGVHPVPFSPDQYDYAGSDLASRIPQDLGHAGFRLHTPFKQPDYYDEVAVFLGASYFRAIGRGDGFGLSARGIAIDTALPSGEEFPWFREFWLLRPAEDAEAMAVLALLDSPSLTGAYRFAIHPGDVTMMHVRARLFRRTEVQKLGVAPLTSMYLYGETRPRRPFADFRPEVHDSDGLQIRMGSGEWIWRPLQNPDTLRVTSFQATDPKGFGLSQRDREWDHYQDLEARPDLRPDLWIRPEGAWGSGRVELVEIPSNSEYNDNIVAYWVPDRLPALDEPIAFSYRLLWGGRPHDSHGGGKVVATRRDAGEGENVTRWIVDFEGGELAGLDAERTLRGVVSIGPKGAGELVEQHVSRNPVTGGWRLVFDVRPSGNRPLDLRAFLQRGEEALTETWTTVMEP